MKSVKELNKIADDASKGVRNLIEMLVDTQSFVEADRFVRSETALGDAVGEGVVCGFASVSDLEVGIFAINGEVLKGGIGKVNATKISKCVNNAVKMHVPVIGFIDSMGARFNEGIEAMEGYGAIFAAFSEAYGVVPTVLVVKGNNYGMLSYLSSVCDYTVCYDKSVTATSSPLILVAGTTEDTAKVGSGAAMAAAGIASATVKDDVEMVKAVTDYVCMIGYDYEETPDDGNRVAENLVPGAKTLDVINEIFDANTFIEIKKDHAKEFVTGYARLNGITVAIVACNPEAHDGKFTAEGARKVSDFISTCDNFNIPVVNIVDTKGAVPCVKCQGALMREIGDMMYLYNVLDTTKVSLITGNAIGLGYVALASKSVFDYVIAWENASIGMLDNVAAAELVYADDIAKAKNKDKAVEKMAAAYGEENTSACTVAEKGFIDNVISPALSRQYLIAAVQAFLNKR